MGRFVDYIDDYRILTDKDMVRKNSRDDYGLGPGWYFCTGRHVKGKWTVVYVKPNAATVESISSRCFEGIGSLQLRNWSDGVRLTYNDRVMISSGVVDQVTDIPEDILLLI